MESGTGFRYSIWSLHEVLTTARRLWRKRLIGFATSWPLHEPGLSLAVAAVNFTGCSNICPWRGRPLLFGFEQDVENLADRDFVQSFPA